MKKVLVTTACLFAAIFAFSLVSFRSDTGPNGGRLMSSGKYKIELIETYSSVGAYLFDSILTPIKNSGVRCKATFFMKDDTHVDLDMLPIGDDSFILETFPQGYHSCRLTFDVFGKPVSAYFESRTAMAVKK